MADDTDADKALERNHALSIERAIQLHSSGEIAKAEVIYRELIQLNPDHPEALHFLGVVAFQVGQNKAAEELIRKALLIRPTYVEAHTNLGLVLKKQGKAEDAVDSFQSAIDLKNDHAEAHYNLANSLQFLNRHDQAIQSYQAAINHNPGHAEARYNQAMAYERTGQFKQAVGGYRSAISVKPDYVEAFTNLGGVLLKLDRVQEAADSYLKAIALNPGRAELQVNLGTTLIRLEKRADAEQAFRQALALNPSYADAYNNLGVVLKEQNQKQEALLCYREAIALNPEFDEAHYNLANLLKELNQLEQAVDSYRAAINVSPEFAEAHYNLATTLQELGAIDEAISYLEKAISLRPEKGGWRIRKALLLPIIYKSQTDIDTRRVRFKEEIARLQDQGLSVVEPDKDVGAANFFLAYQNQDDRRLMEEIAALHRAACPGLVYTASHCLSSNEKPRQRLRIGIPSSFFNSHTISNLSRGFIDQLSRDQFEVVVLVVPGKKDQVTQVIERAADGVVWLSKNLEQDRNRIADEKFDILFYPEIGMDPYTYFLAHARLAPVQVVTWGHPDTTGLPNIDYFISSGVLESAGAEEHYTEKLIKLSALPTYYYRPDIPEGHFDRSDYGLPEAANLYLCPQTLFKFHPDFDAVLGALLSQDLAGYLVLIDDGKGGYWRRLLQERFSNSYPDLADRVIFVPNMDKQKFLGLLMLVNAVLDIRAFSGGNSSLEAFAMGVPIVTWPGPFMRSRVTAGCYKQMGLQELIVSDAKEYVALALKLAHDPRYYAQMRAEIIANSDKLFHRSDVVQELEQVFAAAYALAQVIDVR